TSAIARWRVELVPSLAEYGPGVVSTIDLPTTTVTAKRRRVLLGLDLDIDGLTTPIVQARVTALDDGDVELLDASGEVVAGFSQEFVVRGDTGDDVEPTRTPATVTSLPSA